MAAYRQKYPARNHFQTHPRKLRRTVRGDLDLWWRDGLRAIRFYSASRRTRSAVHANDSKCIARRQNAVLPSPLRGWVDLSSRGSPYRHFDRVFPGRTFLFAGQTRRFLRLLRRDAPRNALVKHKPAPLEALDDPVSGSRRSLYLRKIRASIRGTPDDIEGLAIQNLLCLNAHLHTFADIQIYEILDVCSL